MKEGKICVICKKEKNMTQFYKSKDSEDGRQALCQACKKAGYIEPVDEHEAEAFAEGHAADNGAAIDQPDTEQPDTEQPDIEQPDTEQVDTDHKYCGRCKTTKPRSEFGTNKSKKDGLQGNCKACNKEMAAIRRNRKKAEEQENLPTDIVETENVLKQAHVEVNACA